MKYIALLIFSSSLKNKNQKRNNSSFDNIKNMQIYLDNITNGILKICTEMNNVNFPNCLSFGNNTGLGYCLLFTFLTFHWSNLKTLCIGLSSKARKEGNI